MARTALNLHRAGLQGWVDTEVIPKLMTLVYNVDGQNRGRAVQAVRNVLRFEQNAVELVPSTNGVHVHVLSLKVAKLIEQGMKDMAPELLYGQVHRGNYAYSLEAKVAR